MAFLSSAQILQLNYFEQKKINVGLEEKNTTFAKFYEVWLE